MPKKAIRGAQEESLFDAMRAFQFDLMGSMRSHWDIYCGFGLMITVFLALLAALMRATRTLE